MRPAGSLSTRSRRSSFTTSRSLRSERSSMVSERIRSGLEVQHRVQRVGGEVLVVHGDVVGGVGVGAAPVGLEDLVELLGAVLLRAVEHHVLEEVADAGDAGALVARADLEEGVEAHHRGVVVRHHPDAQSVGQRALRGRGRGQPSFLCEGSRGGPCIPPPRRLRTDFAALGRTAAKTKPHQTHSAPRGPRGAPGGTPGRGPPAETGAGRRGPPGGAPARGSLAQLALERAQPVLELGDAIQQRAVLDSTGPCARVHHPRYAASGGALPQETGLPGHPPSTPDAPSRRRRPHRRRAAPRRRPLPPLPAGGRPCPGGSPPGPVRCRARPAARRGSTDAGGASPPGVRQPEPPDGERRDGGVRHGLHPGHLPSAADRAALVRPDAVPAGDRVRLPRRAGAPPVRPRLRDARPGGRQGARQPHQDGPVRERGPGLPRAVAAAARGVPPALPERAHPADQRALRVDRHALLAARGVALRGDHRPAGAAGAARWTTPGSTTTSARPSTPSTATTR